MRSFIYWLVSFGIAVLSMRAATDEDIPLPADSEAVMATVTVSGSSRAALLGIGIMAVAYTFRQAWLSHRKA